MLLTDHSLECHSPSWNKSEQGTQENSLDNDLPWLQMGFYETSVPMCTPKSNGLTLNCPTIVVKLHVFFVLDVLVNPTCLDKAKYQVGDLFPDILLTFRKHTHYSVILFLSFLVKAGVEPSFWQESASKSEILAIQSRCAG